MVNSVLSNAISYIVAAMVTPGFRCKDNDKFRYLLLSCRT